MKELDQYLVSIIPLMVGSAFPFSIIVSLAAWIVLIKDGHLYIWQKSRIYQRPLKFTGQA